MKYIVITFDEPGLLSFPLNNPKYLEGYIEFSNRAENMGARIFFAGGSDNHLGKGKFKSCYFFQNGEIKHKKNIVADVVFDKSKYLVPDGSFSCINSNSIKQICTDKSLTYKIFPTISPLTTVVFSEKQLTESLAVKKGLVVIKPISGSAGDGVVIGDAQSISIKHITYPVILQEYVDSSLGIPEVVEGKHDFRVNVINGEVVYAFVRTPGEGDYRAGIATGGSLSSVVFNKIPEDIFLIMVEIEKIFSEFGPRLYTIDVAFNGEKYMLIELNSQPGILPSSFKPEYGKFMDDILGLLILTAS